MNARIVRVEKAGPEHSQVGNHAHSLVREDLQSGFGGPHRHAFIFPDGSLVWTDIDGEHAHPLSDETADEITEGGEHSHRIVRPDTSPVDAVETEMGGEHGHELAALHSAWDGAHEHELRLPGGVVLHSLTAGELWEALGSPTQDELAPPVEMQKQRDPTTVQTLIFDKERFGEGDAIEWARAHDFRADKVDETDDSYRLRQREPSDFETGTFRTIALGDDTGVQAVVGQLRASRMAKARQRSTAYLEAMLDAAKNELPAWLWARLHAAAFPSSGGRARRGGPAATALERLALAHLDADAVAQLTDDDLLATWTRLHAMHVATKRAKQPTDALIKVARLVKQQLEKRGRKVGPTQLVKACVDPITITLLDKDDVAKSADVRRLICQAADEDDEKQVIYAVAMEPNVEDAHGEHTTAEEIEQAAWQFLANAHAINIEHKGKDREDAQVVESSIAPVDMQIGDEHVLRGSWLVAIRLGDDLWARAKAGDFGGVSVEGMARRVTV